MEQVQQQIIDNLAMQVWVLGGIVIFLLGLLTFFARNAYLDVKKMLEDHEDRIKVNEDFRVRAEERHVNNADVIREIRTKLELILSK